jgi:hypothetical protein
MFFDSHWRPDRPAQTRYRRWTSVLRRKLERQSDPRNSRLLILELGCGTRVDTLRRMAADWLAQYPTQVSVVSLSLCSVPVVLFLTGFVQSRFALDHSGYRSILKQVAIIRVNPAIEAAAAAARKGSEPTMGWGALSTVCAPAAGFLTQLASLESMRRPPSS